MISATIVGNVGKVEVQSLPDGTPILKFSVASSTKQKGEEVTTWVNCAMFGKRGSAIAQYVTKGNPIAATGSLTLRQYTNKEGKPGSSLEMNVQDVKLLGGKSDQPKQREMPGASTVDDSDIPF